jgi:resuscitation-promoting factor RpfB
MKRFESYVTLVLLISGTVLLGFYANRPLTLVVDGQTRHITSLAPTVGTALWAAGYTLSPADRVQPSSSTWLGDNSEIHLDHAGQVTLWFDPIGLTYRVKSAERIPANLLAQAKIRLFPGDRVLLDGQPVDPLQPLPAGNGYTLQYAPSVPLEAKVDGQTQLFYSSASTIRQALWENHLIQNANDLFTMPAAFALTGKTTLTISHALPANITDRGQSLQIHSAAPTVGQALADANLALQGLDYSQPAADRPLTAGMNIQIVRVSEQILLTEKTIPFTKQLVADATLELDKRRENQPGQLGIEVSQQRVRFENGAETSRTTEDQWTASLPKPQLLAYGTKVTVNSIDTPSGKLDYWRAVPVYATSYSPCRQGMGKCSLSTASGIPLTKGIIAVTGRWYSWMAGQRVYIPGYGIGVIADTGGGIPGRNWIDLGFDEDNFVNWYQTVTIYFLTPVPASIPWTLP